MVKRGTNGATVVIPPLPREDRWVETARFRTRYWEAGSGPPLVLLHGIADSCVAWHPVLDALAERHRVIASDMPGFGLSSRPDSISPEVYVDWLDELLDELDVGRAAIAGHSLGGLLSIVFALARPERVTSLTLVSSAGLGRDLSPVLKVLSLPLVGRLLYRPTLAMTRRSYQALVCDPACVPDEVPLWAYQYVSQPEFPRHMNDIARLGGMKLFGMPRRYVFTERLGEVPAPVQLIWGRHDPLFPVSHAEAAAAHHPQAELHVLEQCAHIPMLEQPREFVRLMLEFLARHPAEPASPAGPRPGG